jgi:hypothetical protein
MFFSKFIRTQNFVFLGNAGSFPTSHLWPQNKLLQNRKTNKFLKYFDLKPITN